MDAPLVFDPVGHYWSQAQQMAEEGDTQGALAAYKKALRLGGPDHPSHWRIRVDMGDAYFDGHHYAQAIAVWEDVLSDRETAAEKAWLLWRLGKANLRRKDYDKAEDLLVAARTRAPKTDQLLLAQVWNTLGELLRLRRAYTQAKRALRRAIAIARELSGEAGTGITVAAYETLFKVHRATHDLAGALKVLLEVYPILEETGDEEDLITPFTDLGIAMIRQNRPVLAERAFATALLCCPDPTAEVYLLSNYASVLCEVNKYAEAFLYIQKAIAYADIDDPQSPEFLATLYDTAAYICVQRDQLDAARIWVQKALDRLAAMPSSPFPIASIYLNLAMIEEKAGRFEEALLALYQANIQNPDNRRVLGEIHRLESRLGLIEEPEAAKPRKGRARRPGKPPEEA